jgi:surface polysaccharide O-acyltransferase-like enzyme
MGKGNGGFKKLKEDEDMETLFDNINEVESNLNPDLVSNSNVKPASSSTPPPPPPQQQQQQPDMVQNNANEANNNAPNKYQVVDINTESTIVEEESDLPVYNKNIPQVNDLKIKKPERLYWVDCLRVFASYLVVFIHCSNVLLKPSIDYKSFNGRVLIAFCAFTRPCVPLFIMISGMLFLNPKKKVTLKMIFNKYIPRIFKCYLFWTLYYGIIDKYIIKYDNKTYIFNKDLIIEMIKVCIIRGCGHLWYLNFTIGVYLMTPIYRPVVRDRTLGWYLVALCCIVAQLVPTIHEFFIIVFGIDFQVIRTYIENLVIYTAGNYLGYYIIGYMVASHEFSKKRYIYLSYFIGLLGNVLSVVFRFISCYHYNKNVHNLSKYYNFNVCMGAYGTFVFFKYAVNGWVRKRGKTFLKIIKLLSDCSMGVYLIHFTMYHIFYKLNFHSQLLNPLYWVPIYSLILYAVCFAMVYVLRKVPFIKEFM